MNFYRTSLFLALIIYFTNCNRPDLSPEFIEWDDYQDERVEQQEFTQMLSVSAAYDIWDANDDTYLNRNEFYNGYFKLWNRKKAVL